MLYEAAIVTRLMGEQANKGELKKLLWFSEKPFIARDVATAQIKAFNRAESTGNFGGLTSDDVEVIIRPFA